MIFTLGNTAIVEVFNRPDGSMRVELNTGGWNTPLTRGRMNAILGALNLKCNPGVNCEKGQIRFLCGDFIDKKPPKRGKTWETVIEFKQCISLDFDEKGNLISHPVRE